MGKRRGLLLFDLASDNSLVKCVETLRHHCTQGNKVEKKKGVFFKKKKMKRKMLRLAYNPVIALVKSKIHVP